MSAYSACTVPHDLPHVACTLTDELAQASEMKWIYFMDRKHGESMHAQSSKFNPINDAPQWQLVLASQYTMQCVQGFRVGPDFILLLALSLQCPEQPCLNSEDDAQLPTRSDVHHSHTTTGKRCNRS